MNEEIVSVKVDEHFLEQKVSEEIAKSVREVSKLFYSLDDLVNITSFSRGHIFNTFFNDQRFKSLRRKVGRKWVFPVEETNIFLKKWILEQPHE